ncbi:MAG: polymerase sigma factor, sigma-70 family [Frankiales bacterium]|nr:polymerase sigma factor, sigma-70 family [Frankiales bacterium]
MLDERLDQGCRDREARDMAATLFEHWPVMVRACRPLLESQEDAEDCASEALVAALADLGSHKADIRNPQAWLVTVARRRAIDHVRVVQRGRARFARLLRASTAVEAHGPDESVSDRYEALWLAGLAEQRLPPTTLAVLKAAARGESVDETSLSLGLTRRSVESHLRRARQLLRSALSATLAVIGWLFAGGRRTATATATASAVVAVALVLMPTRDASSEVPPAVAAARPRVAQRTPVPPVPRVSLPPKPRTKQELHVSREEPLSGRPTPTTGSGPTAHREPYVVPEVRAKTAAGETRIEREDRGGSNDPVEAAFECLDRLTVTPDMIGC